MKKLFFFMGVMLMLVATSCNNSSTNDPVAPENDGEDNVMYRYYSVSQGLCGLRLQDASKQLADLGFTQLSNKQFRTVTTNHIATFTIVDSNDDDTVDVFRINIIPGDGQHTPVLTLKNLKGFISTVGNNVKLFANHTPCSFYGYYAADSTWLGGMADVAKVIENPEVTSENMEAGIALWIDDNIKNFDPSGNSATDIFTGMYLIPKSNAINEGEYNIELGFVINQKL